VDISAVHSVKVEALKAYITQIDKYGESWLTGLKGRELVRGWEAGVERAEAYEVIRMRI
jgi:LmbE family N-acetylglucosaminyl deacetylase